MLRLCLEAPRFALEVGMFRIELETDGVILKTVLLISLSPFQIVSRFGFYRFIVFTIYLNIVSRSIYNKNYESSKVEMTLEE